ncbi:HutD/Ves family protein [Ancylobacter mangrovi]|uniref:HutD/Ves family protein n=1 Tax=Ancylobacter mangrovi TaxID=2972472 RepID=UPI002161EC52|nr:HutD family protein [Ancylobacter mangrovi]MCS0500956.1 HutD family protein [Ancylobacter mangrovi]
MSWIKVLTTSDYKVTPWKNGGGVTQDVLLLPEGATQEDFDIRLSLAPIVAEGPFSSFPGVDRHITLLTRERLSLVFGSETRELNRLEPLYFDSVQQPRSLLPDGAVRVFNVMTRRGRWNAQVMPASGATEPLLAAPDGGLLVLHAVSGTWQVGHALGSVVVRPGETLVSSEEATLRASCEPAGEAVVAFLAPTGPR